ncbi:MAG TPA: histidinol-phosphate transaminase [Bacteroidales bacterium]|nr:histidinol-phosphate transaminase [Bacteroidales bacterium]
MEKDIKQLIRPVIQGLTPYSSARDEYTGSDAVFLDANENPFNKPLNRYPDPYQHALKTKIALLKDVPVEQLFLGNGSDEAIDVLFRIFCEPGKDQVVSIDPTYGMYQVCAGINDVGYKKVLLKPDFSLDKNALKAACNAQTKLLFICTPNNPTSNSFSRKDILELVNGLEVMVIVDEAYIDFSSRESLKNEVTIHKNLVILQTFSKAWGMAGIRLGMGIVHPEVLHYMNKVKYPYNLNALTIKHALEAIENTVEMQEWVHTILAERDKLERKLKRFRFVEKVHPSDANFLLVRVRKPKKVYNYLIEKQIIVRDRSNISLIEGSLRITIGSPAENAALAEALMLYQRDFVDSCEL